MAYGLKKIEIDGSSLDNKGGVVRVFEAGVGSLPRTITDARITNKMYVVGYRISEPSAVNGVWSINTSNGSLTISGKIRTATSIELFLSENINA